MTTFVLKNLRRLFDKYSVARTEHDALVKSTTKILSNFVAFSENPNFKYLASFRASLETILKALPGWGWKDVVPAKTWRSTSIRLQSLSASIQIADLKLIEKCQIKVKKCQNRGAKHPYYKTAIIDSFNLGLYFIPNSRSKIIDFFYNWPTNRETKSLVVLILCIELFFKDTGWTFNYGWFLVHDIMASDYILGTNY